MRVWLLTVVLAGVATLGVTAVVADVAPLPSPLRLPWFILAAAFVLVEIKVIHVHFRREMHSFSLSELPTVLGLFFATPADFLVGLAVGSALALAIHSRQATMRIAFNLSNYVLLGVLALVLFHAVIRGLGGAGQEPGPVSWAGAFVATMAAAFVSSLTIATAISLSGGAPQFQKLPEMLQFGGLVSAANTSLALLAVSIVWFHPQALWLLLLPIGALFVAYRAYVSEREKHERLEMLYQSSRILQHSAELDSALVALLEHARQMFRAEEAEIVLVPRDGAGDALRTTTRVDRPPEIMVPVDLDGRTAGTVDVTGERRAAFVEGGGPGQERTAMVCALVGEAGQLGWVRIADRLGEGTTFEDDDLLLLDTLANQAAVALENGQLEQSLAELHRLKDQLRYQAYHDSLTNLANRALFLEQVEERLTSPTAPLPIVLFLDLDDFKVVNDTLGHAAGDRLLVDVADRISACLKPGDSAARLGGDEFAILVSERSGLEDAVSLATRILDALQIAFLVGGQDLVAGASIGIAAGRPDDRADVLLRNADVAMYTAKTGGKRRFAVFEPTMHAAIVARHALSAEFAQAVARRQVEIHYQPIVELGSGRIHGVEALVRWRHPTRGLVGPDEFIRLAEENGTIAALGSLVLETACRQVAAWQARPDLDGTLSLAVNLSPHQLQASDIVAEIQAILDDSGLAASSLVLELTETAMFQDTQATIAKLQRLRERDVRIAVDDFGTGYSSLGYLRRFPVDILKIAREFVGHGGWHAADDDDLAFANAIISLGRTLGLDIVAEGIEEVGQLERLRELGCGLGQGYLFARPMTAAELEAYLLANAAQVRSGSADARDVRLVVEARRIA